MGEVYKARDTRLGRDVAIKVLPAEFAADPERLRRFEQEARAAAALNHPNILVLHDIGSGIPSLRGTGSPEAIPSSTPGLPRPPGDLAVTEGEGEAVHYLVTELLDGETLRQRLHGGPLTAAKAVVFGIQIAQGLAAAHEKGIVHRDLKPGNLFITNEGRIKILDFGLARLRLQEGPLDEARSEAATADSPTREGKVLGTPGYMAPEQVRGRPVDARTDIFAFGVVLYEMLAGKRAFAGDTAADTQSAILSKNPDPLPPVTPQSLDRVVRRCLEKRPEDRFSSAHDLAFALEAASGSGQVVSAQRSKPDLVLPRRWVRWVASTGGILLLAAITVFVLHQLGRRNQRAPMPFEHLKASRLTHNGEAGGRCAISPDGRYVAYTAEGIWIEQIGTSSKVQIVPAGLYQEIESLTFCPDGAYLYFTAYVNSVGQLFRVPFLGGAPEHLAVRDMDTQVTFSPDGRRIAFVRGTGQGIAELRVAESDGTGEKVLAATTKGSGFPMWNDRGKPAWSPDGSCIAWVRTEGPQHFIQLVDVATGQTRPLGVKRWDRADRLVWLRDGRGLLLLGCDWTLSVFSQLWFVSYPSGTARALTNDLGGFVDIDVSTDGASAVSVRYDFKSNLWVAPTDHPDQGTQVTFGGDSIDGGGGIAWTPSGGLVYTSFVGGNPSLCLLDRPGGQPRRLFGDPFPKEVPAVTPDGRHVVFASSRPGIGFAIWRVDAEGRNPVQLSAGPSDRQPLVTADGRWVLYFDLSQHREFRVPLEGGKPEPLGAGDSERLKRMGQFQAYSLLTDGKTLVGLDRRDCCLALFPLDGSRPCTRLGKPFNSDAVNIGALDDKRFLFGWIASGRLQMGNVDGAPMKEFLKLEKDSISNFAVSPDGKRLAYSRGSGTADVVLIQQSKGE